MNFQAVNLKRVVESVLNVFGRLNKTEGVQLLIEIADDIPHIHADENRLLQILYNLIENSLKFTATGIEPEKQNRVFGHGFGSGVGPANINNRLNKLYGAGLQIKSSPGIGTEVSWCVPLDRGENDLK